MDTSETGDALDLGDAQGGRGRLRGKRGRERDTTDDGERESHGHLQQGSYSIVPSGTMLAAFIHWVTTYGAAALFVLLMVGVFGLPVPDETLLTFAGVLVRQGHLHFATTWTLAALGSMCGITLSYGLGRTAGASIVTRYGGWLHVTDAQIRRVEGWMEGKGRWILTIGYYIPGVRHVTAIVAGSTGVPLRIFAAYAYAGAAIWSLSFITFGWYVGERWEGALETVHRHIASLALVGGALAIVYAFVHARWVRKPRA